MGAAGGHCCWAHRAARHPRRGRPTTEPVRRGRPALRGRGRGLPSTSRRRVAVRGVPRHRSTPDQPPRGDAYDSPVSVTPIRLFGDPVLRTPASPVTVFDEELRTLVADLTDTMQAAGGVGLAAPQLGVSLRVFTWVDDVLGHLVNPELTLSRGEAGRRGGLPVAPRAELPLLRASRTSSPRASTCTASRCAPGQRPAGAVRAARDRPPRRRPVRRPPRPATRKLAMRESARREGPAGAAQVRTSPHPTSAGPCRCGSSSPAPRRSPSRAWTRCSAPAHEVVGVVTRPDAPAGRGRRSPPPGRRARRAGRHRGAQAAEAARPGVPPSWPARRTAPGRGVRRAGASAVLAIPPYGWVNLHFSLLPAWRGAAPVQHAVIAGDEVTGAATFRLEAGWTPARSTASHRDDRAARHERGAARAPRRRGARLLVATLDGIEAGALGRSPSRPRASASRRRSPCDDARVDWARPPARSTGGSAACTPAPGAWTTWRGERLKLGPVTRRRRRTRLGRRRAPRRAAARCSSAPATAGAAGRGQPAGKRPMAGVDWARGVRLGRRRPAGLTACPPAGAPAAGPRRGKRPHPGHAAARPLDAPATAYEVLARSRPRRRLRQPRPAAAAARAAARRAGRRLRDRAGLRHAARRGHVRRGDRRPASTGRWPRSTRRCSTCCGWAPTRCSTCGSRRTPRSRHRRPGPGLVGAGASGFVNAVLRRVTAERRPRRPGSARSPGATRPDRHLALATAHPRWIVRRLRDALGGDLERDRGAAGRRRRAGGAPRRAAGPPTRRTGRAVRRLAGR